MILTITLFSPLYASQFPIAPGKPPLHSKYLQQKTTEPRAVTKSALTACSTTHVSQLFTQSIIVSALNTPTSSFPPKSKPTLSILENEKYDSEALDVFILSDPSAQAHNSNTQESRKRSLRFFNRIINELYETLDEQTFKLDNYILIYPAVKSLHEEFHKLDTKEADTLWQKFNARNDEIYNILIRTCAAYAANIRSHIQQLNATNILEKLSESVYLFPSAGSQCQQRISTWVSIQDYSKDLKRLITGAGTETIASPYLNQKKLLLDLPEQLHFMLTDLKNLTNSIMAKIAKNKEFDLIPAFMKVSLLYDDLNVTLGGQARYEKSRAECAAFQKSHQSQGKNNKSSQSAAAKK